LELKKDNATVNFGYAPYLDYRATNVEKQATGRSGGKAAQSDKGASIQASTSDETGNFTV
jgi:hypothetical protein